MNPYLTIIIVLLSVIVIILYIIYEASMRVWKSTEIARKLVTSFISYFSIIALPLFFIVMVIEPNSYYEPAFYIIASILAIIGSVMLLRREIKK